MDFRRRRGGKLVCKEEIRKGEETEGKVYKGTGENKKRKDGRREKLKPVEEMICA